MKKDTLYAVLTGDLVGSSRLSPGKRDKLLDALKSAFARVSDRHARKGDHHQEGDKALAAFEIYRGDSFQGLLEDPAEALEVALVIRGCLRANQPGGSDTPWDARIAIGIGAIDQKPERTPEGTGEAYTRSGPLLDSLKSDQRLRIRSPWEDVDREVNTGGALLDAVLAKWTPAQAETFLELVRGRSRKEIAEDFGISQAAVHYRVKGAGWTAVHRFLKRYRSLVKRNLADASS